MDGTLSPVVLAVLLAVGAWLSMKMWLSLVVAAGLLRLPSERGAFVRWLEDAMGLEEITGARSIGVAVGAGLLLAVWNVCPLVLLSGATLNEPANVALTAAFYAFELAFVLGLCRYTAKHRRPQ